MVQPTKMTLSASIVLYRMLLRILTDEAGNEKEMPFETKYKLHRCKSMLEKDIVAYEEKRVALVKQYGVKQEDGNIKVQEDKEQEFVEKVQAILATPVEHSFYKITPAEVKNITLPDASADETDLFMACLIEDPELENDLKTPVQIEEGEVADNQESQATNE